MGCVQPDGENSDVLAYPSVAVPDFANIDLNTFDYSSCADAADPNFDSNCLGNGAFDVGASVAVNDPEYRFPFWVDSDASFASAQEAADGYTHCGAGSLCVFIQIPEPVGTKDLDVTYKFKSEHRQASSEGGDVSDYTIQNGHEQTVPDDDGTGLVAVSEVGSDRIWYTDVDGTPTIEFNSEEDLHVCSKLGLCDYETGL